MNEMIVELEYPILAESSNGTTTTVNDNRELENEIGEAANLGCDEEDDIVFNDVSFPHNESLLHNEWRVLLYVDSINQSKLFDSYIFDFKENNTIQINTNEGAFRGTCQITTSENHKTLKMELDTDKAPVSYLSQNWVIVNASPVLIEMKAESTSGEYLNMFILKIFNK